MQLPRCELDDLEEKKVVNLLSDEEPKNQRPFRKNLDFERLLLVQLPRCELYDYRRKRQLICCHNNVMLKVGFTFTKARWIKSFIVILKSPLFKIQAVIRSYQYFNLK